MFSIDAWMIECEPRKAIRNSLKLECRVQITAPHTDMAKNRLGSPVNLYIQGEEAERVLDYWMEGIVTGNPRLIRITVDALPVDNEEK